MSEQEVDKLKKAAVMRMAMFDMLPKELQDVANKHGLNAALSAVREKPEA